MSKNWAGIFALLVAFGLSATAQTFEFESEVYNVNEGAGTVTLTVIRTGPAPDPISVHYETENRHEPSFATAPGDFTFTSGDLTFAPRETSKQFTVPIIEDGTYENVEGFRVILSNPTGGDSDRQRTNHGCGFGGSLR